MKNEVLQTLLSLTSATFSIPAVAQQAPAPSTNYRLSSPAQWTENGKIIAGKIYLNIEDEQNTPVNQNQLHGEKSATFYFQSDEEFSNPHVPGKKFPRIHSLYGDDGFLLLDLEHQTTDRLSYAMYGCNSTITFCEHIPKSHFSIDKQGQSANLSIDLSDYPELKVKTFGWVWNEQTQKSEYKEIWGSKLDHAELVPSASQ